MMVIISYDVNTTTFEGRRRLRKVAKVCVDYGQRVQNSVFECDADATTMRVVKQKLIEIIDTDLDSLRFYYLGNNYNKKIEHFGIKSGYDPEGVLLI